MKPAYIISTQLLQHIIQILDELPARVSRAPLNELEAQIKAQDAPPPAAPAAPEATP